MRTGELGKDVEMTRGVHVEWQRLFAACGGKSVQSRVVVLPIIELVEKNSGADDTVGLGPLCDLFLDIGCVRIERFDEREPPRMCRVYADSEAGIVTVHGKGRNQQCAVDSDLIHGRNHVVSRDLGGTHQEALPRPARMIALIGVDLGVDNGSLAVVHNRSSGRQVTADIISGVRSRAVTSSDYSPALLPITATASISIRNSGSTNALSTVVLHGIPCGNVSARARAYPS